ncbi:UDP-glucose 6-dehydrogenase YwqF [compost metagenome]
MQAFDPKAMDEARHLFGERDDLVLTASKEEALEGADALLIVTEWQDFRVLDSELIKAKVSGRVVFDGRNLFEPATLAAAGISYYGIGRGCRTEGEVKA